MSKNAEQILTEYENSSEKFYDLLEIEAKMTLIKTQLENSLTKEQSELLNELTRLQAENLRLNCLHLLDFFQNHQN